MLTTRTHRTAEGSLEEPRHPFVRLPQTAATAIFQGWGPKI